MKGPRLALLALFVLAACGGAAGQDRKPPTWELGSGGRWRPTDAPATQPIADETLDRVEEMIRNGQGSAAKKIVVAWIRSRPKDAPNRDRAVFLLGQANFVIGSSARISAFYNFDEVLDLYPDSRYFYPALERQFDIADAYLRGYKNRFIGLPMLSAESEATEMLYRIQQRAPGSPLAERALLRVADHYYATGDFDLAADAYAAYVRNYPRSPNLPRVRLRQAFSSLAQFRGIKFDATPVIDARQQLVNLANDYPRLAEEENVAALLRRIDEALARKLLETADFYRRTDKPRGAVYHYRYLVERFPDSPEAEEARQRLARMPAWAVEQVVVPSTTTGPATGPASAPEGRNGR